MDDSAVCGARYKIVIKHSVHTMIGTQKVALGLENGLNFCESRNRVFRRHLDGNIGELQFEDINCKHKC